MMCLLSPLIRLSFRIMYWMPSLFASSFDIPCFINSFSKAFLAFRIFQPKVNHTAKRLQSSLTMYGDMLSKLRAVLAFPIIYRLKNRGRKEFRFLHSSLVFSAIFSLIFLVISSSISLETRSFPPHFPACLSMSPKLVNTPM